MSTMSISHTALDRPKRGLDVRSALGDVVDGLQHWELWSTHGWNDIRQRYRRSIVGPFWLTISMGVMVAGLAYLYAGLFGQSIEKYLPYAMAFEVEEKWANAFKDIYREPPQWYTGTGRFDAVSFGHTISAMGNAAASSMSSSPSSSGSGGGGSSGGGSGGGGGSGF